MELYTKPGECTVAFLQVKSKNRLALRYAMFGMWSFLRLQSSTMWWFERFLFLPLPGEIIQFDEYFSNGWFNHQLVKIRQEPSPSHHCGWKPKVDLQGNDQPISSQKGFWPWLKYCKDFGTCQHPAKSVGKRQWNGRVAAFGPDDCLLIPTPRMRPVKNHQLHDPPTKRDVLGAVLGAVREGLGATVGLLGADLGVVLLGCQGCVYWQWAWTLSCSFGVLHAIWHLCCGVIFGLVFEAGEVSLFHFAPLFFRACNTRVRTRAMRKKAAW